MANLDDAVIMRHKIQGQTYEVYVDADLALAYKSGEEVGLDDVLAVDHVFRDAGAGDKASEEHLLEVFNADDMSIVFDQILKKGDLHLTTEQKRRMLEERRKQVASIIAKNAINPQTNTPHPLNRIEAAMEEARVQISLDKSAKEQVEKAMKLLKPIIPIKFEKVQVAVRIPAEYTGKLYTVLHSVGEVKKEGWEGSDQYVLVEMPAGMQNDFYDQLNNLTHGEAKTKVVKHD